MKLKSILLTSLLAGLASAASAASFKYEFTGGSLAPTTSGLPTGVTVSNFALPSALTWSNLSGTNGNAMRIGHEDLLSNSTATALTSRNFTFSLTIPTGTFLDLNSLTYDFTSNGLSGAEFINARFFSSIDGTDDLTGDTIGVVGRVANGANSGTGVSINLSNPTLNATVGGNVGANDFKNLTSQTIIFSLPFIRSSATGDWMEIDNIAVDFTAVPEPSTALAGLLLGLGLVRRRR